MLTVQEARTRILQGIDPLEPVQVEIAEALGAILAADLRAPHPLPRFANSAMDGYAVRRSDIAGAASASPVTLDVIGEVRAGDTYDELMGRGTCVRIMTGAMVPSGADAVVPIEEAEEAEGKVRVLAEPLPSGHIRPAGEDVEAGETILRAGAEIGPGEAALLASLGLSPLRVRAAPGIAIVVTGDELVAPEEEPGPGRIRDSNSVALKALVMEAGGLPLPYRIVGDDLDSVIETLEVAAATADLVVSAGGVSVGRYDFVKEAVECLGGIDLWRVAMQPGKPVVSGTVKGTPFLGLPGNPVSIHIGFEQFVRPAIRKLRGCSELFRPVVRARLTERLTKRPGRLHFVRVRLEVDGAGFSATPTGSQGSHIQSSLIGCHGVARFELEAAEIEAGADVDVEVWSLPGSREGASPGSSTSEQHR